MVVTSSSTTESSYYDREAEAEAFEESKLGVKGLLDSGITRIPRMFYSGDQDLNDITEKNSEPNPNFNFPIIDLSGLHSEAVEKIASACKNWGFFQVINHGISNDVLGKMINGIRRFHEQDSEVRKKFYSRDLKKKVRYYSNVHMYKVNPANWRDTLAITPDPENPQDLPDVCR